MTIKELAKIVADDFQTTMDNEGFETFAEMKRIYDWEASDIREEINATVGIILNQAWEERQEDDITQYDDGSLWYRAGHEEISYGQFKKMVMSQLA